MAIEVFDINSDPRRGNPIEDLRAAYQKITEDMGKIIAQHTFYQESKGTSPNITAHHYIVVDFFSLEDL